MQQLFQSPQWKILIEYLLSERTSAVDNLVYRDFKEETKFAHGLEVGKVRMIDAFIGLPAMVKETKLKEEQAVDKKGE